MFRVLKRTVSLRQFFWVPTTYVWVRNKKNNFPVHTLILRPASIKHHCKKTCLPDLQHLEILMHLVLMLLFSERQLQRHWSDCIDEQAGLSLCWHSTMWPNSDRHLLHGHQSRKSWVYLSLHINEQLNVIRPIDYFRLHVHCNCDY